MKRLTVKETETTNDQKDMELTKEWINRALKKIHRKMVELFHINFTYFSGVKIIKQSEALKQLTQRMRNDLQENGVVYSDIQWKQICGSLSENQVPGFFENLAFYNPVDEILYINEKIITDHPEKIIPVCTHELSEKLLSTYLPPPLKTPIRALVEAYTEAKKTNNARKLRELLNTHTDIVFKNVFREGCCEAIALQTLRYIGFEMRIASWEKELLVGHSKCIDLLFDPDNARGNIENTEKSQRTRAVEDKLIREILRSFQLIKGVSYYLGYPLARAVVEKYGIRGVKLALENYPPHKAQHFADPESYLAELEELTAFTE